ncbi:hypothetical protein Ancab_015578 [Ancistrocladus abbreviatus]
MAVLIQRNALVLLEMVGRFPTTIMGQLLKQNLLRVVLVAIVLLATIELASMVSSFSLKSLKLSREVGVRSLSCIPSGGFICEHTATATMLFQKDSTFMPDVPSISSEVVEEDFTIDAAKYGNVGRFINHSCSPNLHAQNVLYDNDDRRIPHIMLFAAENIPPLQELAYHYNYTMDQVHDFDGNIKKKNCYCGSSEYTGRMY